MFYLRHHFSLRCAPAQANFYHALCFCFLYARFSNFTLEPLLLLNSSTPIYSVLTHSYPKPLLILHFLLLVLSVTSIMASRAVLLLALCVLPAMVVAIRPAKNPFSVKGRVYCDRCRAGFETSATTYIAGAEVMLQCKSRTTNEVVYTKNGKTDSSGAYTIYVDEDHADEVCNAKLVSSPHPECREVTPGRDEALVILTRYNGIASDDRYANAMGFMSQDVAAGCAEVLRQYQEFDNEN
ncbi:hypothetical protein VIGAN_02123600 [Vigna angularis var. angularis]|uniref:Pollen-specific protein C13 n=1 Tax=Vigna angularis var. angularis TaxID=157739 RepID=A0A0S3RD14_PHAAN|nr:hypothetical protein VIGAN_02123600 [Vigna angularis var. angularis]